MLSTNFKEGGTEPVENGCMLGLRYLFSNAGPITHINYPFYLPTEGMVMRERNLGGIEFGSRACRYIPKRMEVILACNLIDVRRVSGCFSIVTI